MHIRAHTNQERRRAIEGDRTDENTEKYVYGFLSLTLSLYGVCACVCFFRTFFVYTLHACEKKIQPYQRDFDLRV